MPITTDFEKESLGVVRKDAEITVGTTNRGESAALTASLRRDDYVIKAEGQRVHITGGSAEATMAAVERFTEEFVTADGITVVGDCLIEHMGTYPYDSYELAGVPIRDYVVVAKSNQQ